MLAIILALSVKELKKRYHETYLRTAWLAINPIIMMSIFNVVFSKIVRVSSEGAPYSLFVLTALVPWTFFASSIYRTCLSLTANRNLIIRLGFPRMAIPLAVILANFCEFAFTGVVFFLLLLIYHVPLGVWFVYLIPLLLIQLLLTVGIGFIVSIVNAYAQDTTHAMPVFLQAWMLASPIAYPLGTVHQQILPIYLLNPMAEIVDGYRKIILHQQSPELFYLKISFLLSLIIFLSGFFIFKKFERNLADII